jgi:hypothetical protein
MKTWQRATRASIWSHNPKVSKKKTHITNKFIWSTNKHMILYMCITQRQKGWIKSCSAKCALLSSQSFAIWEITSVFTKIPCLLNANSAKKVSHRPGTEIAIKISRSAWRRTISQTKHYLKKQTQMKTCIYKPTKSNPSR